MNRHVTACIPHFRCQRYVRRAVDSLLAQSHKALTVVVVNDGDDEPPWDALASIRDRRLVRFELKENRGPYFATAVVLEACESPYFLIQDADDWSSPRRVERLLAALERDGSDLAVSAEPQFATGRETSEILSVRWEGRAVGPNDGAYRIQTVPSAKYAYRAPHHGLFRRESLRQLGGYYAGLRVSFDTLITNLILMTGKLSHVAEPLYCRMVRPESLSHAPETCARSVEARQAGMVRTRLYGECYSQYKLYLAGKMTSPDLKRGIRRICRGNILPGERQELELHAKSLSRLLMTLQEVA